MFRDRFLQPRNSNWPTQFPIASALFLAVLVLVCGAATRAWAQVINYDLTVIVNVGDSIDGAPPLTTLSTPDVNNNGLVAFHGEYLDGVDTVSAVFTPTELLAKDGDVIEGQELTVTGTPLVNDSGDVVFQARTVQAGLNQGIFAVRGGVPELVATSGDVIGSETLINLGGTGVSINNSGDVSFASGTTPAGGAVIREEQSTGVRSITLKRGDTIDGETLSTLDSLSLLPDTGEITVTADFVAGGTGVVSTQQGILARVGDIACAQTLTDVRNTELNNGGEAIFIGLFAGGGKAIVSTQQGCLVEVGDVIGVQTLLDVSNGTSLNNNGGVAFIGFLASGSGIFTQNQAVALPGDSVGPKTLAGGGAPSINDNGDVAFVGSFTDGSSAVLLAVPCAWTCGNGTRECTEECDDGNTTDGDGCSGVCRKEGFCEDNLTCQPPCDEDADCAPSCGLCIRCGDGRTDTGEACDDGNDVCGDGCDPNCTVPACGNGFICAASGETCDDENTDAGDGCSSGCTCEGTCGDGIPNLVPGCEECDADGANCPLGTCCESGCAADCTQVSRCTGTFDCCVTIADCPAGEGCCGDGTLDVGEECDDGNAVRGDGCNELCQRECAQPLPRATPSPVSSTELKCQQTINKETSKFAKAKVKTLQKCAEAIIKDKTTTDPGPGERVGYCLTSRCAEDPSIPCTADSDCGTTCVVDPFAVKAQFKIDKAASKVGAKIAKVCGGDDRACGTFDNDEATPDRIGFLGTCPGFEGRGSCTGGTNNRGICTADSDCPGGGTCATCDGPINDCDGLATCVACIGEAALDQAIVLYYDSLLDVPAGDLQKCQTTIGKEATKYLQQKEQNLRKCWDKGLKGQHTNRCPDFSAPVDSAAHKAAEKIARAESKMISKICRKCGGSDNDCDDEVRVVNPLTPPFPGSNGGDDPAPSAIGFPATCDAVTVPGGPACGFGVNTLGDLVSCVACVTEFKVDCIDAARMPELQGRVYPCECSAP